MPDLYLPFAQELVLGTFDTLGFAEVGTIELEVDFDCEFEEALHDGGNYITITDIMKPDTIPPSGLTGRQIVRVAFNVRNQSATNKEWLSFMVREKKSFATPRIVLAIAKKFPEAQRRNPMFVIWYDPDGNLWGMVLGERNGVRAVGIGRGSINDSFTEDGYFTVSVGVGSYKI